MKVSIFFKFFAIIFIALLLFQYINIKVDYKSTIEYRLALLKENRDSTKTESLMTTLQEKAISEEQLINIYNNTYQTSGYDVHFLVKIMPSGNYEIIGNTKQTDYNEPYIILTRDYKDYEEYYANREEEALIKQYSLINFSDDKLTEFENAIHSNPNWYYYLVNYAIEENEHLVALKWQDRPFSDKDMTPQKYRNLEWQDGTLMEYLSRSEIHYENGKHIIFKEYDEVILNQLYELIPSKNEANFYKLEKDSYFIFNNDLFTYNISYIGTKKESSMNIYNDVNNKNIYIRNDIVNLNTDECSDYLVFDFYYIDTIDIVRDITEELIEAKALIYLAMTILAFFVSYILSEMLTRPIKNMMDVTTKISNNDFSARLPVRSSDEITVLSENINLMSERLNQTILNLNDELKNVRYLEGVRKEFIANFTHEIKTPIAIINGYIELISNSNDEIKREEYLEAVNKETDRLTKLVMSMLELSQIEAGKKELSISEISIDEIILEIIDSYLPLIKKKNLQLHLEIENQLFEGDSLEIEKVIRNFLSNAIKHTKENGLINIEFKNRCFSIENEGEHISTENMKLIFETYVSRSRDGTGLGLAICKAILELHHFKYGVENTEKGVKFYFEV